MAYRILSILLVFVLSFSSCKKDPIIVSGNEAPPDATIENVTKENYVNKLYISLLGRKATTQEFSDAYTLVNQHNFSKNDRTALVSLLQSKSEFAYNEFKVVQSNYLDGNDTTDARTWLLLFQQNKDFSTDSAEIKAYQKEIDKLTAFSMGGVHLRDGTIDYIDLQKIVVNNFIYDQINMGTENFVVSVFQNYLNRYPTSSELSNAKQMIDYDPAATTSPVLFLKLGSSKDDFISIFFDYDEFFEGQVRAQFQRFLFREPTSVEMATQTSLYKNSHDFKALQSYILSSNEYAGIK
jgi:hypothetical protein